MLDALIDTFLELSPWLLLGMAIAGLVLGYVGIGFVAIVIFLIILGASLSS